MAKVASVVVEGASGELLAAPGAYANENRVSGETKVDRPTSNGSARGDRSGES